MAGMGGAYSAGWLVAPLSDSGDPTGWISNSLVLLMAALFVIVAQNYLVPRLGAAWLQSRRLAEELGEERGRLEVEVAERTADLARRNTQLRTAAEVARDAAAIQDVEKLLRDVVRLVSERFGFYHTGIFLLDDAGRHAVLRAASSAGGQRMLARGHQLRLGMGLVGHVAEKGEYRIALDVGQDAVFFDNPDLPDTRSEIAVPLQARERLIGVLDVQSREANAFGDEDVVVLQTLADQIAVAISNARLFQQAEESLEAERRAYGQMELEAWRQLLQERADLELSYDPSGLLAGRDGWREEMQEAVHQGAAVRGQAGTSSTLAIPLKVRGQIVGVLDAYKPEGAGDWSEEETRLMESLVEQLSVALDSARLYQDTQRRAARDRILAQVAGRMRETLDIDLVLQSAVREMRNALDIAEVEVYLDAAGVES
jgi:GAF domain-containing protein